MAAEKTQDKLTYYENHLEEVNKLKTIKEKKEYIKQIDFSKLIEKDTDAKLIQELQVFSVTPFESESSDTPQRIITLLDKEKLWDYIVLDELEKVHTGDIKAREVLFLCAIGRRLKNRKPFSFNVLLLTEPSAGKDHLIKGVLKLFEKNVDYERYGRISETTLNYLHSKSEEEPNFNWSGKMLYLPEVSDKVLNNEVMKEFTSGEDSEEVCEIAITKRKSKGVDIISVQGKPEVFCSTAKTIPTEEIRNRYNILSLDLSEEQTKKIFEFEEGILDEDIIKFLSEMKSIKVQIPKKILNFMIKEFPATKIRSRRDFVRLKDFVKALALFHGRNIATEEDYNRAKDIFIHAYSSAANIPLRDIDKEITETLKKSETPLSAQEIHKDILKGEKYSIKTIYRHLEDLENKEIIKSLQDRMLTGYFVTRYALTPEFLEKKPFTLPNFE